MKIELEKAYEANKYEDDIYKAWEESGFFDPDECVKAGVTEQTADPFSIVLPPPNVTGTLHMGHAAMLAIEDTIIRYQRMLGKRALWIPGTDHAAIATQSKVEKMLFDETGKTRHDLGREPFLEKVNEFAQQSHDTIVNQCRKMGSSLDWSREAFTLDDKRNFAVRTAFKAMYEDKLIYRGDRIVNWDPTMQSTVSDDEVDRKEESTPFYYFQYGPFEIGTARPETKFGDKYVVMHPEDDRYKEYLHGQEIEVEWVHGKITATVIKDEAVDPEFGTGVMTITPWHDATDFDIAEKFDLEKTQIIGYDGKLLPVAGDAFAGMTIAEARTAIVAKLQEKGLVTRIDEEYRNNLAVNSRGGGIIEPQIMRQWFVDVNKPFAMKHSKIDGIAVGQEVTLKELMQHVVREKHIEVLPERFEKTYFYWIDNLRDWCISRQIWYGHRIPAWYRGNEVYVGVDAPEGDGWEQDSDTLDTWFSSGLWTFSTLGWPDKDASDFLNFHPTNVLETGYDILFFWVARMILMSTYHVGDIPFKTVYLHGLVRDDKGRKMSKSLGNIIDPLDVSDKYGTDAVRLSLLIGAAPGNDTKLSEEKIGGFKNFTNKLWNMSRFMLMNIDEPKKEVSRPEAKTLADEWILAERDQLVADVRRLYDNYQLSNAGELMREFTWTKLADWYLEIAKVEGGKSEMLNYLLNTILKLWHPSMPFVTEAIWQEVYGDGFLMVERFPGITEQEPGANNQFATLQEVVTTIRSLRAEYKIEPAKKVRVVVSGDDADVIEQNTNVVMALARLEALDVNADKPAQAATAAIGALEIHLDLAGAVDLGKEKERLEKEIASVKPYVMAQEKKLGNAGFVDNAPAAVVDAEKAKLAEAKAKLEKLEAGLSALQS